jgi:hypothetical protein
VLKTEDKPVDGNDLMAAIQSEVGKRTGSTRPPPTST